MTTEERDVDLQLSQVKGSWEERLAQALRLMQQANPAGLALSQTLIDRLIQLPMQQRAAADHRLNKLLVTALIDQAHHHAGEERFLAATATLRYGAPHLPPDTARDLQIIALEYLLCDGQVEAALAGFEAFAHTGDLDDWVNAFFAANRSGDAPRAQNFIDQAERWVSRFHQPSFATAAARRDQATVAYLKARHAITQANAAEALAWYEHAMALDEFYRSEPSQIYRHLVDMGAMAEALALVRVDHADPIRAEFWTGLLDFRQGRPAEARQRWHKGIQREMPEEGEVSLLEIVLNHFYLGDEAGTGLSISLDALNTQGPGWGPLFLAGVGWALRGDLAAAHTDLRHARTIYRASGAGRRLPREFWRFCLDLLDPPKCDSLKEYFEDAQI